MQARAKAVLAAAGAGMFASLGQAPLSAWYLAVPAFAALLWVLARAPDARAAAWRGQAAGTGYFLGWLTWIVQPFLVEPETYGWMAPFALLLMAGGLALFWALAGGLAARVWPGRPAGFALALAAAEALRGVVLTGFPWAQPAQIWIDTPPIQAVALIGANGLSLVTLMLAALALAGRRGAGAAVIGFAVLWGGGALRLGQDDPAPAGLTIRLVQPNAEQRLKWDPEQAEILYWRMVDFTAAQPRPDLVIWPETSMPYLYEPGSPALAPILRAADGVPVAMGVQRVEGAAAFNALAVIGPEGTELALYDKAHLVPFGEYLPLGDLLHRIFGLSAFAARQGYGYAAGPGPRVLDLGAVGRALPLICYEAIFPAGVKRAGAGPQGRADWLLQVTNDAWFGTLTGPWQHAGQARMRAIEQGLPLVRVANTGLTQMVDARGRVTAALPFGEAGWLDAPLPGALAPTFYSRWGDAPFLAAFFLVMVVLIARRHRSAA